MSCEACGSMVRLCWYKAWYFFLAVLMLAYGMGSLFIPAAFPQSAVGQEGGWALVVGFSVLFTAANIVAAWGVKRIFQGPIAAREGDQAHYLEKMRNALAAGFGFVAAFRLILFFTWVVKYT